VESGTIEPTLPGLDPGIPEKAMKTGHAIPLTPQKRLMVFAGRSHPALASRIVERLGVELGEIELTTFANGETYCRYCESIRGADVFIVQTGCRPVDQNIMELLFMIQGAGADRVLTMDLHAGQIQGFFTIPVDHMTAQQLFARHFRDLGLSGEGVVSVAPDAGRAKYAVRFAEMIEADFAIMNKTRLDQDAVSVTEVTGRVRDKVCIVGDDVTTTGGTIIAGARALREHGAKEVWLYVTHALLNEEGLERLAGTEDISGIVVTDTVPIDAPQQPDNLTVLSVSGLLAETIMNVFADDSVSAIFGGENQLF